jgi:hypothetical protein
MKLLLFFVLLFFNFSAIAQAESEIKLSQSMPQTRMGQWTVGDYTVLISLDTIAVMLRKEQESMIKAIAYNGYLDSYLVNYYNATAKRYDIAATQLEHAKNGLDLQTLIIYQGRMETPSDILNHGYEIRTFYDVPENSLFYEYYHLGW